MSTNILIRPIITEKATFDAEENNRYGFIVDKAANKVEIRKAVEAQYNVQVEAVNTMNYLGKNMRRYTKAGIIDGRRSDYKKAVVTVKDGDLIDFYAAL
jgi:large subunit ribosomal protein L23